MKKVLVLSVAFLLGLVFFSRNAFASHEITYFWDNKTGAVTITFDDGYPSQYTIGAELLNSLNLRGTFFLVAGWPNVINITWEQVQQVAAQGHEIGSHSLTHPDLTTLEEAEMMWELSESQRIINEIIPSQSCLLFAYPYGESNEQVRSLVSNYYIAARGGWVPDGGYINHYGDGQDEYGSWRAIDFFNIGGHGVYEGQTTLADLDFYLDLAVRRHAWFTLPFHTIDEAFFTQFLNLVQEKDLWVDTFGTVVRYMKERLSSTLTVISENECEIKLDISHSLDNSLYNVPLTIRSSVPSFWTEVVVEQEGGGKILIPVVEDNENEPVVYYDAIPNGGTIVLRKIAPQPRCVAIDVKPGSFPNSINLESKGATPVTILTTSDFDVSLLDLSSVLFAGAIPAKWSLEDVDLDGDTDLVLHFIMQELNLTDQSTEATLTGDTFDGQEIKGIDSVNIVPPLKVKEETK